MASRSIDRVFGVRGLPALALGVFVCLTGGASMAQAPQSPSPAAGAAPLRIYAAGSLRESLTEIARLYETGTGTKAELTFGASGLLRERIEKGEPAQVFASADTQHPETLAAAAGANWQRPTLFVRNSLCALALPSASITSANLLEKMLNPAIKLATSTPKADPSGDYAWALFRKAEAVQPGAYAALDAKALKLTGSADAAKPPEGRGTYAWHMDEGRADVFLTYCTNALSARKEVPRLVVVQIPPALQVGAAYGLTARSGDAAATQFARYLLAPAAQAVFSRSGFGAP
jgi:ABC-type molybdate transport system substrate-binding protein